jgi:hypothetical protein
MDWRELEGLIREERRSGNPVAGAIHSLQLDQNKITLLLSNLLDTEEVRQTNQVLGEGLAVTTACPHTACTWCMRCVAAQQQQIDGAPQTQQVLCSCSEMGYCDVL